MAKFKKGNKHPEVKNSGGNPNVIASAKKKTVGIIDGEDMATPRLDKPRRASGGSVALAPGAANSPMALSAKMGGGKC